MRSGLCWLTSTPTLSPLAPKSFDMLIKPIYKCCKTYRGLRNEISLPIQHVHPPWIALRFLLDIYGQDRRKGCLLLQCCMEKERCERNTAQPEILDRLTLVRILRERVDLVNNASGQRISFVSLCLREYHSQMQIVFLGKAAIGKNCLPGIAEPYIRTFRLFETEYEDLANVPCGLFGLHRITARIGPSRVF